MADTTDKNTAKLSPADAEALDQLVQAGFDPRAARAGSRDGEQRLNQVHALLSVLDALPEEEPPENLVDSTLARIQAAIDEQQAGFEINTARNRGFFFTLRRLTAAAAVFMLAAAALWPVLKSVNSPGQPGFNRQTAPTAGFGEFGSFAPETPAADHNTPGVNKPIPVQIISEGVISPDSNARYRLTPRWVESQVRKPDGTVTRILRPVLVLTPVQNESANPDSEP